MMKNSNIGEWLHWSFGLLNLHHEKVADCFVKDFIWDISQVGRLQKYADYSADTYIAAEDKFPEII